MGKYLYNEDAKGTAGELLGEGLSGLLRSPSRDLAANESSPVRGLEPLDTGGS
ncbi:MAG TPA: hypothetical protein VM694_24655 [Polyangium sp.]|nr:hypothetical protein [Polyangium sp.]